MFRAPLELPAGSMTWEDAQSVFQRLSAKDIGLATDICFNRKEGISENFSLQSLFGPKPFCFRLL